MESTLLLCPGLWCAPPQPPVYTHALLSYDTPHTTPWGLASTCKYFFGDYKYFSLKLNYLRKIQIMFRLCFENIFKAL